MTDNIDPTNGDIPRELGVISTKLATVIDNQTKSDTKGEKQDKRISSLESSRSKLAGATTILGVLFAGLIGFGYWMLRAVGGA